MTSLTDFRYLAMEPMRAGLRDLAAARATEPGVSPEARELDDLIKDLDGALTTISVNAANRQTERERQAKWEEIVPRCRAALDSVNTLNRKLQAAIEGAAVARNRLAIVENQLANAQNTRPRPEGYPTVSELAAQRDLETKCQTEVETARKHCREASAGQDEAAGALFVAQKQFAALQFCERQLRPKMAKEPAWAIGSMDQLSAVR